MKLLATTRDLLDRRLGEVTMYRLVTLTLLALVAVYSVFTATGVIEGLETGDNLLALVVLVVASYASNRLLGLVWRVHPHAESAVITALLLFFLFVPTFGELGASLLWLAIAAVLANASKYVLAWRGRHVLNPAAAGALLVVLLQDLVNRDLPINPIWQTAATQSLLPFLAVAVVLVLWRTRRLDVGAAFAVPALVLVVLGLTVGFDQPLGDALRTAITSYPILFVAGYMVTEPLTLPPRRVQQLVVAAVTGVLMAYPVAVAAVDAEPWHVGAYGMTPEIAILLGNLVAFAFARRAGLRLVLEERRQLTADTHELVFRASRPVGFRAGQYAELTVPHAKADARGVRRVFSISSAPGDGGRVAFALRVPERPSSFKRALLGLEPGDVVHGTGVGGDFVWPAGSTPLLLVAGGIGVTPFVSQLLHHPERDVVLVYAVASADEIAFADVLADRRVVLVAPERPASLPERWTWVEAPFVSAELVAEAVPDLGSRAAFVSGPPAMVNAVRGGLARGCAGLHTDYFSGY